MTWARARSTEQKEERIEEVVLASRKLLLKKGFESVSISDIASAVSFGRSNLYKYFDSKEEIYLKVLAHEIVGFGKKLQKIPEPGLEAAGSDALVEGLVEEFVRQWTDALKKEKAMLLLLSMASTILEKNCSDQILISSKKAMAQASLESFVPFLKRYFPDIGDEEAYETLNFLIITANGLYPLCGLSAHQRQVLIKEGLEALLHDSFEIAYSRMILVYFKSVFL